MTEHLLVLGTSADDALDYTLRSKTITRKRHEGAHITLVWPGAFQRISNHAFDDLHVSANVISYEIEARRDCWIAACRTRVKGPDGLIPSQRLQAKEGA